MKYNFQTYDESESGMNSPKLLIQQYNHNDYGLMQIRPVWVANKNGNEQIRFYGHDTEAIFKSLEITCQWNLRTQIDESYNKPYAWRIQYSDGFNADNVEMAEIQIQMLKKLNKGLKKLNETLGNPESFEDFVTRIALILSIKDFVTMVNDGSYNNQVNRIFTAQDVKRYIKSLYTEVK